MDFDGAIQIFILSFSWQPNKDWKRTEKWFCLGLRMGALEFMIFFQWCFYAEFSGFMNLVSGFMNFICWRFRCWLKDEKIWVWVEILYIWVLWLEKIWEDLLLGLCLCSCWRLICVCVWLTRKGKKNARKSGHVFLCLKYGFVFFGVLVEDEHRYGQLIFFLSLKLTNKCFKL